MTVSKITKLGSVRVATLLLVLCVSFAIAGVGSAAQFVQEFTSDDLWKQGYVNYSNTLVYEHSFDVTGPVAQINSIQLGISVTDDFKCVRYEACLRDWNTQNEVASISLDGQFWVSDDAKSHTFFADITSLANIQGQGDAISIMVESLAGDLTVWKSWLIVDYDIAPALGSIVPTAAVPEPSAGLCFLIGSALLVRRLRNTS